MNFDWSELSNGESVKLVKVCVKGDIKFYFILDCSMWPLGQHSSVISVPGHTPEEHRKEPH